jgi:diguanylate cyclase (GGDEF)-like protein
MTLPVANATSPDDAIRHPEPAEPALQRLTRENQALRGELDYLREQAEYNYAIICRHQAFDLEIIGTNNFPDLLKSIFCTLPHTSDLQIVTLSLLDEDADIHTVMNNLGIDLEGFPNLQFVDSRAELAALFHHHSPEGELLPVMGPFSPALHGAQFPPHLAQPASLAIVPLVRNKSLIGALNLGSSDAMRFHPELGTDFIGHMASIIAICLENVISNELLKYIGLTDSLTGVYNRRYIDRRLMEEIARARRHGHALSCLYLDIDHFKHINDNYGHLTGDEVLREVAARIKTELRQSDALARFGGEEFVALLSDTDLPSAVIVAERIRVSIADTPFQLSHLKPMQVSISIGVATLTDGERSEAIEPIALQLIAKADHALYEAKETGRNRVVTFEASNSTAHSTIN